MSGIGCGDGFFDVQSAFELVFRVYFDGISGVCECIFALFVDDEEFVFGVDWVDFVLPAFGGAGDHSGAIGPGSFVCFGHEGDGFVAFGFDVVSGPIGGVFVFGVSEVDVPVVGWHGVSVAVTGVKVALGGPKYGCDVSAVARIVVDALHDVSLDAASAVCWCGGDVCDAADGDLGSAGEGHVEGVCAAGAGDGFSVHADE